MKSTHRIMVGLLLTLFFPVLASAAIVPVGSGGYTTTFPGNDAAGRNGFPAGSPQFSGAALGRPVPTNDWWSSLLNNNHASNLFTYPYTLKTTTSGLVVSYIPQGVIDDLLPISVGVTGLSATQATVDDFSDWTVTMRWADAQHDFKATAGIGMPFVYFTKQSSDVAQVHVTSGTVTVNNEMLIIENAKNGADFAVYAPVGSTWVNNAGVYTSTLNGKNYWSIAFLPMSGVSVAAAANEYKQYAYVFPTNTTANYTYTQSTGVVRTNFTVAVDVKEGTGTTLLQGLLPHQWAHLASSSPQPQGYSYSTIRGELKTLASNTFVVENKFYGILPTLPYVNTQSSTFSLPTLNSKLTAMQNDQIGTWTDSYNDGQLLNRLIQSARVAAEVGNTAALNAMMATIQERVENWLTASAGEVAFIFYYNSNWTTLIGYPAGHGQDTNLNDHHFHWGYFIHAAAFLEQYNPGWAANWGPMINMLVRDAASSDRNDTMFPYLRNFSPYAGHCWANGFATFPQGNDQESTSESMQFNSALIHWGVITGNTAIRDLGIYLYTTEQTAIEEYWFDQERRNFPATQQYCLVSRIWGNNLDNQTFWTGDIAASYGIELYPIHGGSLYLAHDKNYVARLWNEMKANTTITQNDNSNANLWHDIYWQLAAFVSPQEAITMYNTNNNSRELKFGVSDAQTYYWLHSMNVLGKVDATITANHPIAAVFDKSGRKTYTAQNYTNSAITVTFSDGFSMPVPARQLVAVSSGAVRPDVMITSPSNNSSHNAGTALSLTATADDISGATISKIEFYHENTLIGTAFSAPFIVNWTPAVGNYKLVARATNSNNVTGVSDTVTIRVITDSSCHFTDQTASQGSFSTGYTVDFSTSGSDVTASYQLHDADKTGVVAYLWQESPFAEHMMASSGNNTFTTTLSGQTLGETLRLACKFAYAGGMAVTAYSDYVVGNNCELPSSTNISTIELKIYPNPATEEVIIESERTISSIEIYTTVGQIVKSEKTATNRCNIDVSMLPVGNYILKIKDEVGNLKTSILTKK